MTQLIKQRILKMADDSYKQGIVDYCETVKESIEIMINAGCVQTLSLPEVLSLIQGTQGEASPGGAATIQGGTDFVPRSFVKVEIHDPTH